MRPMATASARKAEPVSVVITCRQASAKAPNGSTSRAKRASASRALRHRHHALGQKKSLPGLRLDPAQRRIPRLRLQLGERGGRLGAIAEQIAAGEMNDVGCHLGHAFSATPSMVVMASFDSGMVAGSMRSVLRRPFLGNGLGKRARRHEQTAASWACAPAGRRAGWRSRPSAPGEPTPRCRTASAAAA